MLLLSFRIVTFELWRILVEVLTKYMDDLQEINEGNATEHNLKTVESIVIFPFLYMFPKDEKQVSSVILNKFPTILKKFRINILLTHIEFS